MCRTFNVVRSSLYILSDTVQLHEVNVEIRPCVNLVFVYKKLKTMENYSTVSPTEWSQSLAGVRLQEVPAITMV